MPHQNKSTNGRTDIGVPAVLRWLVGGLARVAPVLGARLATELACRPRRFDAPAWEREALADAAPAWTPLDLGDGLTHVRVWRWERDPLALQPAPWVLLLHGWEGRGGQLGLFVPVLRERGFDVVLADLPGHGAADGTSSNLVRMTRAVARLVAIHGPPSAVVAHSLGGATALLAATADWIPEAERKLLAHARLAMVAPPSRADDWVLEMGRMFDLPDAVLDHVRRELERRTGVAFSEVDSIDAARRFTSPVLVVQDADDREVPFWIGEAYAQAMPQAETMWTKGLGHRRVLKDPDVIAAVAEFCAPRARPQRVRSAS
jgi:pimeloyl-ACP methyl ester carboxylesterase